MTRLQEIRSFIEIDTFETVDRSATEDTTHIFRSNFVDLLKTQRRVLTKEGRLVVSNYHDVRSDVITARVQTLQRFGWRFIISLIASPPQMSIHTCDLIETYDQSHKSLEWDGYSWPLDAVKRPALAMLRMIKQFYNNPEFGPYWCLTYPGTHISHLEIV